MAENSGRDDDLRDALLVYHTLQLQEAEQRIEVLTRSILEPEDVVAKSKEAAAHHRDRLHALKSRASPVEADLAEFRRWAKRMLDS